VTDSPVLRNGLYNVTGQAARGVVALLTIPVLVRCLGIHEYGVWSLAYALLSLMLIGEAGISIAAAVFLSRDLVKSTPDETSSTLTFVLASGAMMALLVALLIWFLAPVIARSIHAFSTADRAEVRQALQLAAFAVAAFVLQRILVGIEQAFDRYAAINVLDLVQSIVANSGLMIVAWAGGRSVSMMKWQVLAWVSLLIAHGFFVLRLVAGRGFRPRWNAAKAKRMLKFMAATWSSVCGSAAFSQCDRLIVGGVLGAPILGVYSAITNIVSKINSFSGMAVQPLVPSLSRDAAGIRPVERRVREAAQLNALIAGAAGILLCIFADQIMAVMIPGATTPQDIWGLQIAVCIYALYSANAPGYFILFAVGQEWKNAIVTLSSAALALVLVFAGARWFGLLGALAGNVGYLGTLLMVGLGIEQVQISLGRYASWVAFPLILLATAMGLGLELKGHVWLQSILVMLEGILLTIWFSREQNGIARFTAAYARMRPAS
jgi:O-antigen/teichoic acid export membrane protein